MEKVTNLTQIDNNTFSITSGPNNAVDSRAQSILIIQNSVAAIGIVTNLTVIIVFLNHKKLRRKIPNIFIINQVRQKYICNIASRHKVFLFMLNLNLLFIRSIELN